jgi:ribokinase
MNMDLVIRSPHIPRPGETIIGSDFQTIPGGKGANQAVAAARLGGEVSMVGRVGDDAFADVLLDNLSSSGVNAEYVRRDENAATGVALIVVDDAGENIIVVASGANMQLDEGNIRFGCAAAAVGSAVTSGHPRRTNCPRVWRDRYTQSSSSPGVIEGIARIGRYPGAQ